MNRVLTWESNLQAEQSSCNNGQSVKYFLTLTKHICMRDLLLSARSIIRMLLGGVGSLLGKSDSQSRKATSCIGFGDACVPQLAVLEGIMLQHAQQAVQVCQATAANGRSRHHPPRPCPYHCRHISHLQSAPES